MTPGPFDTMDFFTLILRHPSLFWCYLFLPAVLTHRCLSSNNPTITPSVHMFDMEIQLVRIFSIFSSRRPLLLSRTVL
ncbi:hypothetical protein L218DRAFT_707058 [Marasmius fiardii PR-910]|nr:hypothetical protein L218DRAFT_707058 [Marasmius fiardii PR-910]